VVRRFITLTCEICGKKFEARARRKSVHCRECAEELRRGGQGPVQVKGTASVRTPHNNLPAKEIRWEQAESDLAYYLKRFNRFPAYDGVTPSDSGQITDEDRQLANKVAARMSAETWAQITAADSSIAGIGDWDLMNMNDLEWQRRKEVISEVLRALLRYPGIGVARLTKGLHRKRPNLIPICDSVVLKALGVRPTSKPNTIITCMEKFRIIGRKNTSRLQKLRETSKQLQAEMTELRILELLYWVQFGPFPAASQKD
jgi:hypothetical protein